MNELINNILNQSKSYEQADFLRDIFGPFCHDGVSGNIPVVLFGAGSAGKELYPLFKSHGIEPVCFCDNNQERHGDLCCGIRVISPSELSELHKNSLVVTTVARHHQDIKAQLVAQGLIPDRILSIDEKALTRFYSHVCLAHWTEDALISHEDFLLEAYNLMADDSSRSFYIKYLSLLTNGSDYRSFRNFIDTFSDTNAYAYRVSESFLYFNTDIVRLYNDEVLIDCGAYDGDSAIEFITACKKQNVTYKHIHCFEPDPFIFDKLSMQVAPLSNISINNCGLWTHSTTISFVNTEREIPGATRVIRDSGDIHFSDEKMANSLVPVVSIDEQFPNEKITFIKMDIEGAEIEAIQGAQNLIRRCKPRLAISLYHKRNDIFEIPLAINRIIPGYKFYLRQFSDALSETVLFAIP